MPRTRIREHDLQAIAEMIRAPSSLPAAAGDDLRGAVCDLVKLLINGEVPEGVRHPYGFLVVYLARFEDLSALRLHLWPPAERPRQAPDWPLHSHPWDLKSVVLTGKLKHDVRRLVPGRDFSIYEIEYDESTSTLVRTGDFCSAEPVVDEEICAGTLYDLNSRLFHAIDACGEVLTASLVLTAPPSSLPARVLGAADGAARHRFIRNRGEECFIEESLRGLQSALPWDV